MNSRQAYSSTNFYIVPHEDDWQLFMSPNAYYDVQDQNSKVVFVYVTAGDGGLGDQATQSRLVPYYVARENGAHLAVRFMADVITTPAEAVLQNTIVADHSIRRAIYKNTVSYFLRLPDGKIDGSGYVNTGYWSL